MRNVSIVYKKGRRESCGQLNHPGPQAPRRSVDEYYTRLIEKEKNRESINQIKREMVERAKLRTASHHRKHDQFNILTTLNIAAVPIHLLTQPTSSPNRQPKAIAKFLATKKMSSSRPVLAGLHLIPLDNFFEEEECNSNVAYSKLKCLHRQKHMQPKETTLAISVNFILNEKYFWGEQCIEEAAVRPWKLLESYSNLVWVCLKEDSLKKLLKFSRTNGLRLDAVYQVIPKKTKKLLTVGYSPIQSDFGIKYLSTNTPQLSKQGKKLIIVNGLLIEDTRQLSHANFGNSIPICKDHRSVVYYTRIDPNDTTRFSTVVKMLSQSSMPKTLNLLPILRQFQAAEDSGHECNCDLRTFRPTEINLLEHLQTMKTKLIKFFERSFSMSLSNRVSGEQGENSVQFILGDAIRRNYRIFKNYHEFCSEYEEYAFHMALHSSRGKEKRPAKKLSPTKYRNMAYLWEV